MYLNKITYLHKHESECESHEENKEEFREEVDLHVQQTHFGGRLTCVHDTAGVCPSVHHTPHTASTRHYCVAPHCVLDTKMNKVPFNANISSGNGILGCFGTARGPLDCLSGKLKNFMIVLCVASFQEIHIWWFMIVKFPFCFQPPGFCLQLC